MYASIYPGRSEYAGWENGWSKVDVICEKLRLNLERNVEKNLLPIISCLVKSSRSDVASALSKIDEIRGKQIIGNIFFFFLDFTNLLFNNIFNDKFGNAKQYSV